MDKRTCSVDGCDSPHYGHGWCNKHWARWRTYGDPLTVWRPPETCSVEGCGRPHYGRGYCQKHWQKWRKYGDPLAPPAPSRQVQPSGTCSIEGCGKPHKSRGWCQHHYSKWKNNGDPLATPRRSNRGLLCSIEDCGKDAYQRGWCRPHYRRWHAYGDPLGTPPIKPCAWPGGCDKPVWVTKSRSKMCLEHAARVYQRRYLKANTRRVNDRNRRYARKHPEKVAVWSKKWRDANPEKNAQYRTTRQARVLGLFVERVYRSVVFKRDKGICGICHKKVDPKNWHLDHIVPLARGGEHSYANVQVSHPFCNVSKGTKIIEHQLCLL